MRCLAYPLPAEIYGLFAASIEAALPTATRDELLDMAQGHAGAVELLSGEWRLAFADISPDMEGVTRAIDAAKGMARLAVRPASVAAFVEFLREPKRRDAIAPVAFASSELAEMLVEAGDTVALICVEEDRSWLRDEAMYEIVAMRPEVFELIAGDARKLVELGDLGALSRLCGDHAEAAIEFSPEQWQSLREQATAKAPELLEVFAQTLAEPVDYTTVREALALVSDAQAQPSLDAWVRVHADVAEYALFFRDGRGSSALVGLDAVA